MPRPLASSWYGFGSGTGTEDRDKPRDGTSLPHERWGLASARLEGGAGWDEVGSL